jgi:type IV secretion system protein VirB4
MQFLPRLTADPDAWRKETPAGRHLPYLAQVDDHSILTRDGLLMQVLHLRGLLFETADSEELNYRKALRHAMLQAIGSERFALYHHIARRRVRADLTGIYPDAFSRRLDEAWGSRLAQRALYANDLYLTLVRRPPAGKLGLVERARALLSRTAEAAPDLALTREIRALDAARDALVAALSSYGPRLLGTCPTPQGRCSEPLAFLSSLYHGEVAPRLLPRESIADYLPDRRIAFGQNAVETAPTGHSPRGYAAMLSIKDYPAQTAPGMLDELLRLPFELTVTQSFAFVDRRDALSRMNQALRRMRASDDEALSLRDELALAKDDVASGRAMYGEHHMTVAVRGDQLPEVDRGVAEVQAALADLGIAAVREELALEPAFWAQFPGNFKYIARRGLVSTANFAGLASGHNFAIGQAAGNHWGAAVAVMETSAAGPYYFNFHQQDLGNFTVIGPSGSGKTVVLNFLLAQARKFAPRIMFFDKDRGAEPFIRAIGGRYDRLSPGTASGLNPLRLADTPANRQFLIDWLAHLAAATEPAELVQIKDAVDANFDQPVEHRRLRHLASLFLGGDRPRPDDLWHRLRPWVQEGEHGWLFDNAEDRIDPSADVVGFDMTQLLDDPAIRTAAMMYLFHRVEERLDGHPAVIVVDEGWKMLDDKVFVRRIKDWEKTIRKRNGIVGFATQSAQDALQSRIASAIIEQAATQIFMANPKARAADYVEGFGLTTHEYDLVRALPPSGHAFLVKHGHDSVVVRLDLGGETELLTILSGRERTVRLLDEIRAEVGDDPADWLPRLVEVA